MSIETELTGVLESSITSLRQEIERNGYVFLGSWRISDSTLDIARSIGSVWEQESWLQLSGASVVQTLLPTMRQDSSGNRYSGIFGLSGFPLHTDLAHLPRPPRYLLLRCVEGLSNVSTLLLKAAEFISAVGKFNVDRALVRPRRPAGRGKLYMLPIRFRVGSAEGIRWDSEFLVPMNDQARHIAESIEGLNFEQQDDLQLINPGDTLLIDNYQVLHGRGAVPLQAMNRRIERVFLDAVRP